MRSYRVGVVVCLATIELFLSAQRDDMCMHGFVGGCKSGDQPDPAWCLGRPASDCYNAEFADTCCRTCDEYKVRNASQPGMIYNYILGWRYSVLLFSRPRSDGGAIPWTYFLHLSLPSVILADSSTESPVHVLMLSIQAVRGLPRLRASGIVPCILFLNATPLFSHSVTIVLQLC